MLIVIRVEEDPFDRLEVRFFGNPRTGDNLFGFGCSVDPVPIEPVEQRAKAHLVVKADQSMTVRQEHRENPSQLAGQVFTKHPEARYQQLAGVFIVAQASGPELRSQFGEVIHDTRVHNREIPDDGQSRLALVLGR